MLNTLIDFFSQTVIKYLGRLPTVPYSFDSYVNSMSDIMGYVNYFIPFYAMKTMFDLWAIAFLNAVSIIVVYTWAKNIIGR